MSGDILKKAYLKGWVPLGEVKKINGASCKRFCGTNSTPGASQYIVMSLIFPLQIRQTSLKPQMVDLFYHILTFIQESVPYLNLDR